MVYNGLGFRFVFRVQGMGVELFGSSDEGVNI